MAVLAGVIFALAVSSVSAEGDQKTATDASSKFNYFSPQAKEVVERLQKYIRDADEAFVAHAERLKKTNDASLALEKYTNAVESVKGSKCAVEPDEEYRFNGAQENVEAIIKICMDSVFQNHMEDLKHLISEALVNVQDADNILRKNSERCSSDEPISAACVEERNAALLRIRMVLSNGGFTKISSAFFSPKVKVDSCVEDNTKDLKESIVTFIKDIVDCRNTLKLN